MGFSPEIEALIVQWQQAVTADDVGIDPAKDKILSKISVSTSSVIEKKLQSNIQYFDVARMASKPKPWLLEKIIGDLGITAKLPLAPVVLSLPDQNHDRPSYGLYSLKLHNGHASAFDILKIRALEGRDEIPQEFKNYAQKHHDCFPNKNFMTDVTNGEFIMADSGNNFKSWLNDFYEPHKKTISSAIPFFFMASVTDINPGNIIFDPNDSISTAPYFIDFESHINFSAYNDNISIMTPWDLTETDFSKLITFVGSRDSMEFTEKTAFVDTDMMTASATHIVDTLTNTVIKDEIGKIKSFAETIENGPYYNRENILDHLDNYGKMLKTRRDQLVPFFSAFPRNSL